MILRNPKPVSQIQKERELEGKGTVTEQLSYVLNVLESNRDIPDDLATELIMTIGGVALSVDEKITELTMMLGSMGGEVK